jgi:hypothetical protein
VLKWVVGHQKSSAVRGRLISPPTMAEAIGLAASVIAVSQTAWAVAKGLYDLADEVGSTGEARPNLRQ